MTIKDFKVRQTAYILGAMTGPGSAKQQPKREWVEDIVTTADIAGIPVFMKDSLIPIMGKKNMRREFPWENRKAKYAAQTGGADTAQDTKIPAI